MRILSANRLLAFSVCAVLLAGGWFAIRVVRTRDASGAIRGPKSQSVPASLPSAPTSQKADGTTIGALASQGKAEEAFKAALGAALRQDQKNDWLTVAVVAHASHRRWEAYAALRRFLRSGSSDPVHAKRVEELRLAILSLPVIPGPEEALALYQAEQAIQEMRESLQNQDLVAAKQSANVAIAAYRRALADPAAESEEAWLQLASAIVVSDDKSLAPLAVEAIRRLNPQFHRGHDLLDAVARLDPFVPKDVLKKVQGQRYDFEERSLRDVYEEGKCAPCLCRLAEALAGGIGVIRDNQRALDLWICAADLGDAGAMHRLGVWFENGEGGTKDLNESVAWYRRWIAAQRAQGWIGVYGVPWGGDRNGKGARTGEIVLGVVSGSPAEGNLQVGDVILSVNRQPMAYSSLPQRLAGKKPGERIDCSVLRSGKTVSVSIKLGAKPKGMNTDWHDREQSIQQFGEATRVGDVRAFRYLAHFYVPEGPHRDLTKAVGWLTKGCESDDPLAMHELGLEYHTGKNVAQDNFVAMSLLTKAAKMGDARSMGDIAWILYKGEGVERDYTQSMTWWKQAAAAGLPWAMNNVGIACSNAEDYSTAMQWFMKSARAGYSEANMRIGELYEMGRVGPPDPAQAIKWYLKGAESGDPEAMIRVSGHYHHMRDYAQALSWARRSADLGDRHAMACVGEYYQSGDGVEKSLTLAMTWSREAADAGYPPAMYNVAMLYAEGWDGTKNYAKAREWMRLGAAKGYAPCQEWLKANPE